MPVDYKASQIRTQKIIASGSISKPQLLLYSHEAASNDSGGVYDLAVSGIDSWLFISGGINSSEKVVFGGDATISGTLTVGPHISEPLIYAHVDQNLLQSRIGIKKSSPVSTVHIGGSNDPGLVIDTGAIVNYGRNSASSATFLVQGKAGGDHGLLVVSGSCDRVSIGKHNPNAKLDILGDQIISGSLYVTSSIVCRSITGSIKYVNGSSTPFIAGATYDDATGQWTVTGGGGGSLPGGSDTFIQFNDSGALGGVQELTYDKISSSLALSGSLNVSGSTFFGEGQQDKVIFNSLLASSIIPDADSVYTLGTSTSRFAHIYTGDLHLKNERGDWTVIEEKDFLTLKNNLTGKRYKISMTPLDD